MIIVAACHFVAYVGSSVVSFSRSMGRFDSGASPTLLDTGLQLVSNVLGFPMDLLTKRLPTYAFPGLSGYLPVGANSLLWGLAIVWLLKRLQSRQTA